MRPIDADALIEFCAERWIPLNIDAVNMQPTIQPVATDTNVGATISKFIDGLEETFAYIREREGGDSVCGLCEYDGAYIGESGDWCNECPGFNRDDCFKLSDETRKKWTDEIIKALPTIQPELDSESLIQTIETGITATNSNDAYSLGMRNGMRWCKSLIDGAEPKFEYGATRVDDGTDSAELPPAQPEPQWIPVSERLPETEEFVLASLTGKYRNITFEHACEIADYADGEWCVYAYPHMSAEKCEELIEAWMPLPEAYKPNK